MGMTSQEYWNESPRLVVSFREAQKIRNEVMNMEAWLYGLYNHHAVAVAIINTLGGKGSKKEKYLEKPLEMRPSKQESVADIRQRVVEQLDAWKKAWDASQEHGEQ